MFTDMKFILCFIQVHFKSPNSILSNIPEGLNHYTGISYDQSLTFLTLNRTSKTTDNQLLVAHLHSSLWNNT
jgi:hypothetical protein